MVVWPDWSSRVVVEPSVSPCATERPARPHHENRTTRLRATGVLPNSCTSRGRHSLFRLCARCDREILPKFQREISENRIGGSNLLGPPARLIFLERLENTRRKVRVFRAKSALLEREPNQENGSDSPVKAQSFGFSLLGSQAVRFFDASGTAIYFGVLAAQPTAPVMAVTIHSAHFDHDAWIRICGRSSQ